MSHDAGLLSRICCSGQRQVPVMQQSTVIGSFVADTVSTPVTRKKALLARRAQSRAAKTVRTRTHCQLFPIPRRGLDHQTHRHLILTGRLSLRSKSSAKSIKPLQVNSCAVGISASVHWKPAKLFSPCLVKSLASTSFTVPHGASASHARFPLTQALPGSKSARATAK